MKRFLVIALLLTAAVISCQKAPEVNKPVINEGFVTEDGIRIILDPVRADDTKAVKTGWEDGDAILVFFSTIDSPKYLKMVYSSSSETWSYHPMDAETETAGALSLSSASSGTLCAVYLPFLRNITARAGDGKTELAADFYLVDNTYGSLFTYYLTAITSFTISAKTLTASLAMSIPVNFVQFYVPEANETTPVDRKYTLHTDAVIPSGIIGIRAAANEIITRNLNITNDLNGYVYGSGYIFSGLKNPGYEYGSNFYFSLKKTGDDTYRKDLFVTGKTLSSKAAVLLPAEDSNRWVEIGSNKTVALGKDAAYGTWCTLNDHDAANFASASALATGSKKLMPKDKLDALVTAVSNKNVTATSMSLNGKKGLVLHSSKGGQFVFLPLDDGGVADYWCASMDTENAYTLHLGQATGVGSGYMPKTNTCRVRLLN